MARKRKNPTTAPSSLVGADMPAPDKHEQMLSNMHSALCSLGDKIRKTYHSNGDKLLPSELQTADTPEATLAREHIANLHRAFKGAKK